MVWYDKGMTKKDDAKLSAPPSQQKAQEPQSMEERLQQLERELQSMKELAARAQADLQNAKTRAGREAEEIRAFAAGGVLRRLLPTLDNFQRAFLHVPEELNKHEWVRGVAAIEAELLRQLSDAGLKRMQSQGQKIDPHCHEVLTVGPGAEGMVVEVFEEGYELNGNVLRPAKVRAGRQEGKKGQEGEEGNVTT